MHADSLVSIVVDNYNHEVFLGGAIESALRQTHPRVEVIVVDDGSTDESKEVIEAYGDRLIGIFKENGGQASAFNAGFAVSRGEMILFLDSDDELCSDAAAVALARMSDTGCVHVHWPMHVVDVNGRATGRLRPSGKLRHGDLRDEVIRDGPDRHVIAPTSGNAWARSFLRQVLPMPLEPFRLGADAYLAELSPLYGLLERLDEPHGTYRSHPGNVLARTRFEDNLDLMSRQFFCIAGEIERYCRERGLSVDRRRWERNSWTQRIVASLHDVSSLTTADDIILLADDDEWAAGHTVCGRRRRPFPEREGVYWGAPGDDSEAISELEREREYGAGWLFITWPVFWWLDWYTGFRDHLQTHYTRALENDRLVAWDLRTRRS